MSAVKGVSVLARKTGDPCKKKNLSSDMTARMLGSNLLCFAAVLHVDCT